ncbi:hypothetical protein FACS189483_01080 [Spirochaetia bacterium]|nr:hypothetical protein FACS189483_01080 [Spirochaetia bacterium]
MKRGYCFCIVFFLFLCVLPHQRLYADMDSFKDFIEAEEGRQNTETGALSSGGGSHGNGFGWFLWNLFEWVWFFNNTYLQYGDYPYDGAGYIRRPWDAAQSAAQNTAQGSEYSQAPDRTKPYWFAASASGFYLDGMGAGAWASFSGNVYKFFGPYADAFMVTDGENTLGGVRLGLHLSLFQSNVFNMSLYSQWQLWYGLLSRNGGTLGLEFRLYPFKPLTLRAKLGMQLFDSFTLEEAEVEGGFMLKAWEFFGGYRWWGFGEDSAALWIGPYLGVRRYF